MDSLLKFSRNNYVLEHFRADDLKNILSSNFKFRQFFSVFTGGGWCVSVSTVCCLKQHTQLKT